MNASIHIIDKQTQETWMGKLHKIADEVVNIADPIIRVRQCKFIALDNKMDYASFLKRGSPLYCSIVGSYCRADVSHIGADGITFKVRKNDLKTYSPFEHEYSITVDDIDCVLATDEVYTFTTAI